MESKCEATKLTQIINDLKVFITKGSKLKAG